MSKHESSSHRPCEDVGNDHSRSTVDSSPPWPTSAADEGGARYSYRRPDGSYWGGGWESPDVDFENAE